MDKQCFGSYDSTKYCKTCGSSISCELQTEINSKSIISCNEIVDCKKCLDKNDCAVFIINCK